jgi:hypothetical protein
MNHLLNVPDLIVGGMLMVSSAFAYFWTRNRPELVRGLTYKQFVWCLALAFVGGALTAVMQFSSTREAESYIRSLSSS